ncbi:MAG: hypothetical protein COW26_05870 [Nitrosopumilales archaeon CG15_BIG_FIL_POST_REV_8_21_14_020_33_23]|nr:MAG: hypothetical protein COV65_03360 [Nitrosopumilales archaeon CG11_big_fil_rev_8_21_14_0_20_33_24]PIW34762.1 MAG: hypothetical protein COW26_05870 [Nitrosopumilales archaeon CG15_BIG_FIL_POST_REV_8_21_14_020_33_23]PIY90605.1 MAG: hypothetical protein COY74_00490 [Nitrosopumilales archaeon CG_4_10_14_0_8_um_filter_34_8]PJB97886.1 MAG: hypothetical protein CO079_04995 [Nitrosopumilales archaeon CG_4_9_14_0_8_um_filter_34_10]
MLAKSLVIFISVGVLAGFSFGFYLLDMKNTNQLVYVDGSSLSIVTEKSDFKRGEEIKITIINSGTNPLTFSDTSYGLKISGLFGIVKYSPFSSQIVSTLNPREEIVFVWDQMKNDSLPVIEGLYKISADGIDSMGNKVEKSITVNIWK